MVKDLTGVVKDLSGGSLGDNFLFVTGSDVNGFEVWERAALRLVTYAPRCLPWWIARVSALRTGSSESSA